jgi:predicted RNA-binding Zn-ribbon protein involved in translation (DUF1610 family)
MTKTFGPMPGGSRHCRHYSYERGPDGGPRCAVGVNLGDGGDPAMPVEETTPTKACMPIDGGALPAQTCMWREEWSDEERAARHAWLEQSRERMMLVMMQMPGNSIDRKNKPEWGKTGQFPCPACGDGTVRWTRARVNGHLHAGCSTPFCFSVMQ